MAEFASPPAEFDRTVAVAEVGAGGVRQHLVATPAERTALARRYGIIEIKRLEADIEVVPERRGRYRLRAAVQADVVQTCVVTLDPLESRLEERFEVVFAPDADAAAAEPEVVVEATEEDPPEPIVGGRLAVGEMIAQYLSLALDPYPRRPGVALETAEAPGESQTEDRESPFAILRKLG